MPESIQQVLSRVRKARVHITYDVEEEGAMVKKELPFVVGVMGDFSGDPTQKLPALKDRKFINIDRDNFDDVLAKMTPGLNLEVDNTLKDAKTKTMKVNLEFNAMEDFEPGAVVQQVKPLRELLEARNKLQDILSKATNSEEMEANLEEILQNTDHLKKIAQELGVGQASSSQGEASDEAPQEEKGDN